MHILFYDAATPLAYDSSTPRKQALGGTEATIIRIAEALKTAHQITIAQHCRRKDQELKTEHLEYLSFETAHTLQPDIVILLRHYRGLENCALHFPKAKRYLWLHNMPSRELYKAKTGLARFNCDLIAVSLFHRLAIERRLKGRWYHRLGNYFKPKKSRPICVKVIYNPIDDDLEPDNTMVQANQLLFMSAPEKGLLQILGYFETLKKTYPDFQLLIANPGYSSMQLNLPPGARFLGALPREQLIQELRRSFCVFYPQTQRVETFGLVYAEANAVGTPVLAHDSGAASEVLSDPCQLVDGGQMSAILLKLAEWQKKRPVLRGKQEFRLSTVRKEWLKLLESS